MRQNMWSGVVLAFAGSLGLRWTLPNQTARLCERLCRRLEASGSQAAGNYCTNWKRYRGCSLTSYGSTLDDEAMKMLLFVSSRSGHGKKGKTKDAGN